MKSKYAILLIMCGVLVFYQSCKKEKNPIEHEFGLFPETLVNLNELNNKLDDNNISEHIIKGNISIIFSSSGQNSGNLEQGALTYIFDKTTGELRSAFSKTNDVFTKSLIDKAVTQGKSSVPYRFFCKTDGFEYFIHSSENSSGKSNLFYMKNIPMIGTNLPAIQEPFPITLLNTAANDAYISFDQDFKTAYFSSDRDGNFNIYTHSFSQTSLSEQFDKSFSASVKLDDLNSAGNDECPFVHKNVMVFASDRFEGYGGFDLYYSVFKDGKWSAPINFGPEINTEFDEYMPILGSVADFKNSYLIFSSNREGKEEFDLYFKGITLPK